MLVFRKALLVLACTATFTGCGAAHIRTNTIDVDFSNYSFAKIGEVRVYSLEESAKTNEALQTKLGGWRTEAEALLRSTIESTSLEVRDDQAATVDRLLVFELDSNVRYGNRALRWAVGFGAGKGGVTTTLKATDDATGVVVYTVTAESDLSMGGAGGDMEAVFNKNIEKLLTQFRVEATGT